MDVVVRAAVGRLPFRRGPCRRSPLGPPLVFSFFVMVSAQPTVPVVIQSRSPESCRAVMLQPPTLYLVAASFPLHLGFYTFFES